MNGHKFGPGRILFFSTFPGEAQLNGRIYRRASAETVLSTRKDKFSMRHIIHGSCANAKEFEFPFPL